MLIPFYEGELLQRCSDINQAPPPQKNDGQKESVIDSGWEGYRESRRCSRDTYPEKYITKYTSIRREHDKPVTARFRLPGRPEGDVRVGGGGAPEFGLALEPFRIQVIKIPGFVPGGGPATPESWKRLPKVNSWKRLPKVKSLCTAVVFKSRYRSHKRFENDLPRSALWRGASLLRYLLLFFFFTLVPGPRRFLSPKLSGTRVYAPQIRARLGTTAHFCKVVVLNLRAVPSCADLQHTSDIDEVLG